MPSGRRLARALIALLSLIVLVSVGLSLLPEAALARLLGPLTGPRLAPAPPPPTLLAERGQMPTGAVALQEWAAYQDQAPELVGSGFLLRLADGTLVGVTSAHSLPLGDPARPLEQVAFAVPGQPGFVAEFERLHGPPGRARTGADLTVDYVLLEAAGPVEAGLALAPDPRGAPQPGERVTLFSGLGSPDGSRRALAGTAQSADPQAVWVLMDETFDPGRMSGSPVLSDHTGLVVGLAIAARPVAGRLLLGLHPIGSIVRLAQAARESPALAEYRP